MRMQFKYLLIYIAFLIGSNGISQLNIDSLTKIYYKLPHDSNHVNILNDIGWELMYQNTDTAIVLSKKALALSRKIKYKLGIGKSIQQLGTYYLITGKYAQSLNYYFKILKLKKDYTSNSLLTSTYGNIGSIYKDLGDFPKALEYYFKALKRSEKMRNKYLTATWLGNIGTICDIQGEGNKALNFYFRALKLFKQLNNKNSMATVLCNIGISYVEQKQYQKSLTYYFEALKIDKELNDQFGVARLLGSIGNVYLNQINREDISAKILDSMARESLSYYEQAIEIASAIGDIRTKAINLENMGNIYVKINNEKMARNLLDKTMFLYDSLGLMKDYYHSHSVYSELEQKSGNFKKALYHYKKFKEGEEKLINSESAQKQTRIEMNYEFEKKSAATKAKQDQKNAIAKEKLAQKETERNYFIAGFVLVLLLALFILRGFRQKQKANILISKQKAEVEHKNEIIEEKQKEILDSIRYAKRIQVALLPSEKYIQKSIDRIKIN